jgi:DNA-binding NtrC family response regulator
MEAMSKSEDGGGGEVAPETIPIVCDDPSRFEDLTVSARSDAARFVFCGTRDNVLSVIKETGAKIVILEGGPGTDWSATLLSFVKTFDALIEVIIAGPAAEADVVLEWIEKGATAYLAKPFLGAGFRAILGKIREKRNLRRETYLLERELEKKYSFHGLKGKSPFMLEVFTQIEKIAEYYTTVLITGETGTGKELAAKAVHELSPRRDRPFVVCDCVSMPENLFESELFGYERGAFTGADRRKKGLFDEANGGTILLDEIGEIPLAVQAKLLRVLETREFRPLGATENRTVDVRVIAATNRIPREEIRRGTFREDLFHRLSRIEIRLPPLRDRREDIPLLIRSFLEEYSEKIGKKVKGLSQRAQKALQIHPWQGNVRQLKNVVESAFLMSQKDFIDLVDLPKNFNGETDGEHPRLPSAGGRVRTLHETEKAQIILALEETGNNLRQTAKILDISRSTLYEKIRKHGIVIPQKRHPILDR